MRTSLPLYALLLALAGALAACAGGPSAETPAGVELGGTWKLNHAASDDPQKLVADMRAKALKIIGRQQYVSPDSGGLRTGGPGGGGPPPLPTDNPALGNDEPPAPADNRGMRRLDPLRNSPMMHLLTGVLQRGDYLTVRQSSQELVLDYGTTARSFTPGARSVVSSAMGVADQVSGWNGREYVIDQKAQLGPSVHEQLGLSQDGKQLVDKVRIGPAELPAIQLTRVYDRTTEAVPRVLPTTD